MFWNFAKLSLCVAGFTFLAGCSSSSKFDTVPVTGKVTYKGQAVDGASVTFLGEGAATPAAATTAADGTYSLITGLDAKGAVPGKYRVVVVKTETEDSGKKATMEEAAANANKPAPEAKKLLPEQYADPAKTPLTTEVKAGTPLVYDIELKD